MNPDLLFKLLMLAIWMGFLISMRRDLIKSLASRHWVRVGGRIISSSIGTEMGPRGVQIFIPVVEYNYKYEGKEYKGNRLTFLGTSSGSNGKAVSKWLALRYIRPFAINQETDVFVNPKSPGEAVLLPGVHWSQYLMIVIMTIIFLGIAFIVPILNFIWPGCQPNCNRPIP